MAPSRLETEALYRHSIMLGPSPPVFRAPALMSSRSKLFHLAATELLQDLQLGSSIKVNVLVFHGTAVLLVRNVVGRSCSGVSLTQSSALDPFPTRPPT